MIDCPCSSGSRFGGPVEVLVGGWVLGSSTVGSWVEGDGAGEVGMPVGLGIG